jgi:hypothetical protein
MSARPPVRWLLGLLPLLWLAPLGLVLVSVTVPYVEAREGAIGWLCAWVAVLLPLVAGFAVAMNLRPLGCLTMAWLALNVVFGVGVYLLVALLMFST